MATSAKARQDAIDHRLAEMRQMLKTLKADDWHVAAEYLEQGIQAIEITLRLAVARTAIRNAPSKPAYLAAATDEWEVLNELDGFADHVAHQEAPR